MYRSTLVILSSLISLFGIAQTSLLRVQAIAGKIPPVVANIDSAWKLFQKSNSNVYDMLQTDIRLEFKSLASQSGNKSYFLAQLGETYRESIDYSGTKSVDKILAARQQETNLEISASFDAFSSAVNLLYEQLAKREKVDKLAFQNHHLALAKTYFELQHTVVEALETFEGFLVNKGYYKLIETTSSSSPSYISALEGRGFVLNKLHQLIEISKGSTKAAADWVEACKKDPSSCN